MSLALEQTPFYISTANTRYRECDIQFLYIHDACSKTTESCAHECTLTTTSKKVIQLHLNAAKIKECAAEMPQKMNYEKRRHHFDTSAAARSEEAWKKYMSTDNTDPDDMMKLKKKKNCTIL